MKIQFAGMTIALKNRPTWVKPCLLLVLIGGMAVSAGATQYCVATTGNDTNPGTSTHPFQTIQQAANIAVAGDTVIIQNGTYRETVVVQHAGTPKQPIIFQAAARLGVILDGANINTTLFQGANNVTLRGIVFRNAPGKAYTALVLCNSGWTLEDCVMENNLTSDGVVLVDGAKNVTLERCIIQDIGNNALGRLGGNTIHNLTVKDCICRRCNRRANSTTDGSGTCKILLSDGTKVENLVCYDSVGSAIWLDTDNFNYAITGCTIFGNHGAGTGQGQIGGGIWAEISQGPGRIADNLIYSCAGAGIGIWESSNVIVEHNTVVDCDLGLWWRAMDRPPYALNNVTVRHNTFAAWRTQEAQAVNPQEMSRVGAVSIDYDTYSPTTDTKMLRWGTANGKELMLTSLQAMQTLGFEKHGIIKDFSFDRPLFHTSATGPLEQVGRDGERYSIDAAIHVALQQGADHIKIPVYGRTDIVRVNDKWCCEVYDLATDRHLQLALPTKALRDAVEHAVSRWAMWHPQYLSVRLGTHDSYHIEATALGVTTE